MISIRCTFSVTFLWVKSHFCSLSIHFFLSFCVVFLFIQLLGNQKMFSFLYHISFCTQNVLLVESLRRKMQTTWIFLDYESCMRCNKYIRIFRRFENQFVSFIRKKCKMGSSIQKSPPRFSVWNQYFFYLLKIQRIFAFNLSSKWLIFVNLMMLAHIFYGLDAWVNRNG